jgi:hypothetical protein
MRFTAKSLTVAVIPVKSRDRKILFGKAWRARKLPPRRVAQVLQEHADQTFNEAVWNRDFRPRERIVPVPDRRGAA